MDVTLLQITIGRIASTFTELKLAYKVVLSLLLAVLLHKAFAKPKTYKTFPVWATIEIAITSYLLCRDGVGRRIL
jgi:hypothetical protein